LQIRTYTQYKDSDSHHKKIILYLFSLSTSTNKMLKCKKYHLVISCSNCIGSG